MPIKFNPRFILTLKIAIILICSNAVPSQALLLPGVLSFLVSDQIKPAMKPKVHLPGIERDEREVHVTATFVLVMLEYVTKLQAHGSHDQRPLPRQLTSRQRKVLGLFQEFETITSRQIGELFGVKRRAASALCASWVASGFLEVVDPSNKGRRYALGDKYRKLLK